jgi:hypothetical protein
MALLGIAAYPRLAPPRTAGCSVPWWAPVASDQFCFGKMRRSSPLRRRRRRLRLYVQRLHRQVHRRTRHSGASSKKNWGFCSSECREAAKKAPRHCEHGRRKDRCSDCGTGNCQHGRRKGGCRDCGTGYCDHGRRKSECTDCGTGCCQHGRRGRQCKDCGAGA